MLRLVVLCLAALALAGCAKTSLPDSPVRAGTAEEFAASRAELVDRFSAPALAPFDTAVQELQLAHMDRLPSAAERAAAMRAQVHGRTVRAVEILGWQARRARLAAEIASFTPTLEHDLQTQAARGADTPLTVTNRIQNLQDILAKLRRLDAEAAQQLAAWDAAP
jgi:di/tripeptidase